MAHTIVFNGTPYCPDALAAQSGYPQTFKLSELEIPLTLSDGPLTVYTFQGQHHLLMGKQHIAGRPLTDIVTVKVLSKHQLKHCRLEDVQLRKTGAVQEVQQEPWRRPYQQEARRDYGDDQRRY